METPCFNRENWWAIQVVQQRDQLHAIVCAMLAALGNGACASSKCSIEFLSGAPAEVGAVVSGLMQQRDVLLKAAMNLRDVKGRHHSEIAYKLLETAIISVTK